MELRFIGVGAAFYPALGSNSAFFTRGDDLFLLDCGELVFERLLRAGVLERCPGEITVAITHTHADHAGSLGTLCLYAQASLGRRVTIVHPDDGIVSLLDRMGVDRGAYSLARSYLGHGGNISISPLPVRHVPAIPAFAYFLRDEDTAIYYSGDSVEIPPQVLNDLRSGALTRAYQDVSYVDASSGQRPPHLLLSELESLTEGPLRSKLTLMHLNCDYRAKAAAAGFACAEIDPIFLEG